MNETMEQAMKSLHERMIERADQDGLPLDHPLRVRAKEFKSTLEKLGDENLIPIGIAKSILGSWARARRSWCDYTGEELIQG